MKPITREQMIKDLSKYSEYIKADFSKMDFWDVAELWEMFADIEDQVEEIEKDIRGIK